MIETLKRPRVFLPLIILLALLLRWPCLGDSFYGDEHFSLMRDSFHLFPVTEDAFRPLYFSLLYIWRQIGFHGEIGLRLLSLIFGLAQIPLAYFVGKRVGGDRLARVFAILIAASPMLIEFSQEMRMYSMVAFIGLWQILAALRAVERPTLLRWAIFVLAGLIGVYTHLHYWLFLICFVLTFFRLRKTAPFWHGFASVATVGLLYLPNLPNVIHFTEVRSGTYFVHLPSALPKLFAAFTVGFNYFELPEQAVGRAVGLADLTRNIPLALLVMIPALIILTVLIRLHIKNRRDGILWLGHELFTAPVLLAAAATMVTRQYWLQPKYLIFSTPVALLFLAYAYISINRALLRRCLAVCGAAIVTVALLHFWNPQHYGRRENWIGLTNVLKQDFTSESALVLLPDSYSLLRYYWPSAAELWQKIDVPPPQISPAEYAAYLKNLLSGKRDVYYIRWDTQQNEMDPRDVIPQALDQLGMRDPVIQYNPRFFLYHWRLNPD